MSFTPNAIISAVRKVTGQTAVGKPSLSTVTLKGDIPCVVVDPHQGHVREAQANNVSVERVMKVHAGAFTAIGYTPQVRDRLTFGLQIPGESISERTMMISHTARTAPGVLGGVDVYTLMLVAAEDDA